MCEEYSLVNFTCAITFAILYFHISITHKCIIFFTCCSSLDYFHIHLKNHHL